MIAKIIMIMRFLLLLSTLTTACLAKQNKIINIKSSKVGNSNTIRGGHKEIELTMVFTGAVDDMDDQSSIDGAAIAVEHHHSHHQDNGQSHHSKSSASHENNGISPENFDFYVYSMSYQPEFCRENKEKYDGCHAFDESWEGQLTIHGLWPNNNDGTYPSTCTDEQLDISLLLNLYDSLAKKWPNIKAVSSSSPQHDAFWAHEWSKHGTCSGLSQFDYFSAALGLLVPTPAVVKERYGSGGEVMRQELEEGYKTFHQYDDIGDLMAGEGVEENDVSSSVILVCKSGYLSEVRVCYEKKTTGEGGAVGGVGERIQCPNVIAKEDTCEDTIKIASFGSTATEVSILARTM